MSANPTNHQPFGEDFDLQSALSPRRLQEYLAMCNAVDERLVNSNHSAHVVWEIVEFLRLANNCFLWDERELLMGLLTDAADRVVVTVAALIQQRPDSLHFQRLEDFLRAHTHQSAMPALGALLASVDLKHRRQGLLGRAKDARDELIAHFNLSQAMGVERDDRRLLMNDVLDLQDEAQDIFRLLRCDDTHNFMSLGAANRHLFTMLAATYGGRVQGPAGDRIREMQRGHLLLQPGVSPWRLGSWS